MKELGQFIKNIRSILVLDGNVNEITRIASLSLPIIATDGAANQLLKREIVPSVIIGDLDSFDPSLLKNIKSAPEIIRRPSQEQSDFQKALEYIAALSLLPALIIGISGGYLDHILNNIAIFIETRCILLDKGMIGFVMKAGEQREIETFQNSKISLLGIPNAVVQTKGLKWELENTLLSFPGFSSCFNRTQKRKIKISVKEGTVLILLYLERISDCGLE